MLTRVLEFITSPIENYILSEAQNIIKNPSFVAQQYVMTWFSRMFCPSHLVESFIVPTKDRALVAHKLQLKEPKQNAVKKAIIYLTGNNHYVAYSLSDMEPLLKEICAAAAATEIDANVAVFCQDYRGRGFNQENENENYNNYSIAQDAEDQGALIRKLIADGYQQENIFILGYSYGSLVGLWAIYRLIKEHGLSYANIKFYSDRGFGNLLDYPLLKYFIVDQSKTHERLHDQGIMPEIPLHDIAQQLPESLIFQVEDDRAILSTISLANNFKQNELPGRIWEGKAKTGNPHFASHDYLHLKSMPELKPYHFMTAMLYEVPIKLDLRQKVPNIKGYALKTDATQDSADFVDLPKWPINRKKNEGPGIHVTTNVEAILINDLHVYCCERSERAAVSGLGNAYNHAWLGRTGVIGWTAKEQVQMAIRIMSALANENGPDIKTLRLIQQESGPHQSGGLNKIMLSVNEFIREYEKLQQFNTWTVSMISRRKKRMKNEIDPQRLFSGKETNLDDWILPEVSKTSLKDLHIIDDYKASPDASRKPKNIQR